MSSQKPLPASFQFIYDVFAAMDTVLHFFHARSINGVSFDKLAKCMLSCNMRKEVTPIHLQQIVFLFPSAYYLTTQEGRNDENKRVMNLIVEASWLSGTERNEMEKQAVRNLIESSKFIPTKLLNDRKRFFHSQLCFIEKSQLPLGTLPSLTIQTKDNDPVSFLMSTATKDEEFVLLKFSNKVTIDVKVDKELACLGQEFLARQQKKDDMVKVFEKTKELRGRLSLLNRSANRFYQLQEFFRTKHAIPYHELGKLLKQNTPGSTLHSALEEIRFLCECIPQWLELKRFALNEERWIIKMKHRDLNFTCFSHILKQKKAEILF